MADSMNKFRIYPDSNDIRLVTKSNSNQHTMQQSTTTTTASRRSNADSQDISLNHMVDENNNNNNNVKDAKPNSANGRLGVIRVTTDLMIIIIIFILFLIVFVTFNPTISYFSCSDTDIWYPYKADTVPFWAVGVYGALGPLVFFIAVELLNVNMFQYRRKSSPSKVRFYFTGIFNAISLFALGIAVTLLVTEIGKRWIGRLRPHFMDVCKPDLAKLNCTRTTQAGFVWQLIYTGDGFCTGVQSSIKEARLSFPSGHSSFSCYTMLFLIIYLEARLFLHNLRYVKRFIQLAALLAAFITCISRVSDYHHRGSDVIGGAIIGIVIGFFVTLVAGRSLWDLKQEKKRADESNMDA